MPDLARLQIRAPGAASPLDLALPQPTGWRAGDLATLAELSYRVVVAGHLEPLALALGSEVAEGLLWGNAASAAAGTLGVLVRAQPSLLEPATALGAALLARGRARGRRRARRDRRGPGVPAPLLLPVLPPPRRRPMRRLRPGLAMIQTRHACAVVQIVGVIAPTI